MNPLYVGIDVSSKANVVYLMLPDGSKHSNFSVANSHDGSTQLVKRILSAITSLSLDTVIIGLEATSVYGDYGYRKHLVNGVSYRLWQTVGAPSGFLDGFGYGIRVREAVLPFLNNKVRKFL